jgi:hypothetical protein
MGDWVPGTPWLYLPHGARLYCRKCQLPAGETFRIKTAWPVELLRQADAESSYESKDFGLHPVFPHFRDIYLRMAWYPPFRKEDGHGHTRQPNCIAGAESTSGCLCGPLSLTARRASSGTLSDRVPQRVVPQERRDNRPSDPGTGT